jgi:hypothetical protein
MSDASRKKPFLGCSHCHLHHNCPVSEGGEGHSVDLGPNSRGAGLVVSTVLVFLLPLSTGIAGAALAARWLAVPASGQVSSYQGLGLVVGLAAGVMAAKVVLGLRRSRPRCSTDSMGVSE